VAAAHAGPLLAEVAVSDSGLADHLVAGLILAVAAADSDLADRPVAGPLLAKVAVCGIGWVERSVAEAPLLRGTSECLRFPFAVVVRAGEVVRLAVVMMAGWNCVGPEA
jgi:hypothetical protein